MQPAMWYWERVSLESSTAIFRLVYKSYFNTKQKQGGYQLSPIGYYRLATSVEAYISLIAASHKRRSTGCFACPLAAAKVPQLADIRLATAMKPLLKFCIQPLVTIVLSSCSRTHARTFTDPQAIGLFHMKAFLLSLPRAQIGG